MHRNYTAEAVCTDVAQHETRTAPHPIRRTRRNIKRIAQCAKDIACYVFDVSMREMEANTRSQAHIAFARQTAMYLCRVGECLSLSEIGYGFARDRTTVAHACQLVEDCRDEGGAFDALLTEMEEALRLAVRGGDAASVIAPSEGRAVAPVREYIG